MYIFQRIEIYISISMWFYGFHYSLLPQKIDGNNIISHNSIAFSKHFFFFVAMLSNFQRLPCCNQYSRTCLPFAIQTNPSTPAPWYRTTQIPISPPLFTKLLTSYIDWPWTLSISICCNRKHLTKQAVECKFKQPFPSSVIFTDYFFIENICRKINKYFCFRYVFYRVLYVNQKSSLWWILLNLFLLEYLNTLKLYLLNGRPGVFE